VSGVDVDRLVVGSEAGGSPLALGAGGDVPPVQHARPAAPKVRVDDRGRTHLELHVPADQAGSRPFWLVLGESQNRGWTATVNGKDVGESTLVDGYANGWLIRPHDRAVDITLEWTPQKSVWLGVAISGLTLLLCTALALGLVRRRRNATAPEPEDPAAFDAPEPELDDPRVATGARPSTTASIVTVLTAALVAGIAVQPWVGLVTGALVAVVLVRPRLRFVLSLGAVAAIGAAGLFTAVQQLRYSYPAILEWPQFFEKIHIVGWIAVVFLAADTLVTFVRTRAADPRPPASTRSGDHSPLEGV
jgi:hypothetical protein